MMILGLSPDDAPYALAMVRVELTFARNDEALSDRFVSWSWARILEQTEPVVLYVAPERN